MNLDIGGARTFGNDKAYRELLFIILDFQKEVFPWLKVRLGGKYYHQDIQFKIDITKERKKEEEEEKEADTASGPLPPQTEVRLFNTKIDKTVLRDAYLQMHLGESVVLKAGKQTIVWGQLDIFSPVDFFLPIDLSTPLSYSKVDLRLPVTALKLSWFPTSRMELQGYYFPTLTYDPALKNALGKSRPMKVISAEGRESTEKVEFKKPTKEEHYAARALYYGDWATVGFTYFKGHSSFIGSSFHANRLPSKVRLEKPQTVCYGREENSIGTKCNTAEKEFPANAEVDVVNVSETLELNEIEGIGFEFAKTVGDWVWKFEITTLEDRENQRLYGQAIFENLDQGQGVEQDPYKAYWDFVLNKNRGKLYAPRRMIFLGAGFDAKLTRWNLSFYIYQRTLLLSDSLKKLREKKSAAVNGQEEALSGLFPAFNISYGLDAEKEKNIGLAAGLFGLALGGSFYFLGRFWESLRVGVSVDAVKYLVDDFLARQTQATGQEIKSSNEITLGLRTVLIYTF